MRMLMIINKVIGFRGINEDHDLRWYWWNPIAWILVFIGAFLGMFFLMNPFKMFFNAFNNDRLWNGM